EARLKYRFRCVVKQGDEPLTTNAVRLIKQVVFAITAQPVDFEDTLGSAASFHVAATGTDLTYQWQYSTNGANWYNSTMAGSQTDTLTMELTEARLKYQFRCVVTQGNEQLTTNAVRLIKRVIFEIVTQPVNYEGELGSWASFHVEATGTSLTYQWQYSSNGANWYDSTMDGCQADTLMMELTNARLKYQFRCVVKQGVDTLTTDPVHLVKLA
nr:hypothetical protein [Clostridia bacterium]